MKDARLLDVLAFRTGRRCLFWDDYAATHTFINKIIFSC